MVGSTVILAVPAGDLILSNWNCHHVSLSLSTADVRRFKLPSDSPLRLIPIPMSIRALRESCEGLCELLDVEQKSSHPKLYASVLSGHHQSPLLIATRPHAISYTNPVQGKDKQHASASDFGVSWPSIFTNLDADQIDSHKSYHPYLESNKQKVREDEAKARAEELAKEQKMIDNVGLVSFTSAGRLRESYQKRD